MEKLLKIQSELKSPKNQHNNFGNYNYRSCEDILEAFKPLLLKYNCTLTIDDEIINIGSRYYVKAKATITDNEKAEDKVSISAYAREAETKKGMDESQITVAASSYSRKCALNGLFLIDDTRDADTRDNREVESNEPFISDSKMEFPTKEDICNICGAKKVIGQKGLYCKPCYIKWANENKK